MACFAIFYSVSYLIVFVTISNKMEALKTSFLFLDWFCTWPVRSALTAGSNAALSCSTCISQLYFSDPVWCISHMLFPKNMPFFKTYFYLVGRSGQPWQLAPMQHQAAARASFHQLLLLLLHMLHISFSPLFYFAISIVFFFLFLILFSSFLFLIQCIALTFFKDNCFHFFGVFVKIQHEWTICFWTKLRKPSWCKCKCTMNAITLALAAKFLCKLLPAQFTIWVAQSNSLQNIAML